MLDALSGITLLQKSFPSGARIWSNMLELVRTNLCDKIVLQWVPSHVGIYWNEEADKIAAGAVGGSGSEAMPLSVVRRLIKSKVKARYTSSLTRDNHRSNCVGLMRSDLRLSSKLSREKETLLAQLRCDQSCCLGSRRYIANLSESRQCRWCLDPNPDIKESVLHLFNECTSADIIQLKQFHDIESSDSLSKKPSEALMLTLAALSKLPRIDANIRGIKKKLQAQIWID